MPSAQVVCSGPLILPLFSTPQAEWEAHLSFQSLSGVYTSETYYFGEFKRYQCPEKVEVFGGSSYCMLGRAKFFLLHPLVMDGVDFGAQKTCHLH